MIYNKTRLKKLIEGNEKVIELNDHDTSFTVGFNHYDIWVHNPLYSECLRFEVDPVEYYGEDFINSSFVKSNFDEPFAGVYLKDFADKFNPEKKYAVGVNSEVIVLYRHPSEILTKNGWDETDEIITIPCYNVDLIDLGEISSYINTDDINEIASCYYEYCIIHDSPMSKVKL